MSTLPDTRELGPRSTAAAVLFSLLTPGLGHLYVGRGRRGVVLLAGAQAGIEVAEFPPATVKKCVVGEGGAMKEQVGFMVQQMLRLKEPPRPHDAADACAIALTYLLSSRVRV